MQTRADTQVLEPLIPREVGDRPLLHCSSRPALRFLRYTGISGLIGIGVVLLLSLNQPSLLDHVQLFGGIVMGMSIGAGSLLAELVLLRGLLRTGIRPVLAARCVSFFLGGAAGYVVGTLLSRYVFGIDEWTRGLETFWSMAFYGGFAVAIGLTFHTVESLKTSLADKVSQLKEREYADREMAMARLIQKRLMPPEQASGPGFSLAASNRAADFVAGDFYDYFHLPDGTMGFAIADVAGKGIGASLQMAMVKAVLPLVASERVRTGNAVAGTLDDLNERLCRELGPREFVALLYGRFDPVAGTVEIANAGLPDPYWICDTAPDELHRLVTLGVEGERLPLGVRRGTRYLSRVLQARGAGVMVLFTDGLVERRVGDEPLGYERFESLLESSGVDHDPVAWLQDLQASLDRAAAGAPEDDDCTVMVIRCEMEAEATVVLEAEGTVAGVG